MKRVLIGASAVLVITLVAAGGFWMKKSNQEDAFEQRISQQQQDVTIPANLLKTTVQGHERIILNGDGRLKILYFGFTQCPDICPTSLAVLSSALKELDPKELSQIDPVFVSLDPKRDDAKLVDEYSGYFHPAMRGMSLHEGQLKGLSQMLGVYYKYVDMPDSKMDYSVDHNSYFYFLDSEGNLLQRVPHTISPEPILASIKQHLKS